MRHEPTAPTHVTPALPEETHIQHEEEPTILGRWLAQAMEQGPLFWLAAALGLGALVGLILLTQYLTGPNTTSTQAWTELASIGEDPLSSIFSATPTSEVPTELENLALSYPDTSAARWSKLQAASILLSEGSGQLPTTTRNDGIQKLLKAQELFDETARAATDATLRRVASFGSARAAEARLGLDLESPDRPKPADVVALYKKVAADFPDTPEAERAEQLAARLENPLNQQFYEQLAKFDPDAISIPLPGNDPLGPSPGSTLAPGQSESILDMLRPGGSPSGIPGASTPRPGDLLPPVFTDPSSTPSPSTEPSEPTAPEPSTPAPTPTEPEPAPSETPAPAPAPSETPEPETPTPAPSEPAPSEPTPAPSEPAPSEPTPAPSEPAPAPSESPDPAPTEPPAPAPSETPMPEAENPGSEVPENPFPTPAPAPSESEAPAPTPESELPADPFPNP